MTEIKELSARVIFDSRGDETIEVRAVVDGSEASIGVPSGKSRGSREVEPFPPGGPMQAVAIVREKIAPKLVGQLADDLEGVDHLLSEIDGTTNFAMIGGNTALAVSLSVAAAAAKSMGTPLYEHLAKLLGVKPRLPLPLGNVLGGGRHAGRGAPDIQEFLVLPIGARSVTEALKANILVHRRLGEILQRELYKYPLGRNDEGGYSPPIDNTKALQYVSEAAALVSDELGFKIAVGLDVAASTLYNDKSGRYVLASEGLYLDEEGLMSYFAELSDRYELIYLEDPFKEDDLESFSRLAASLSKTLVCGDDLLVTRAELIEEAARVGAVRAVIIKPNQVGTLSLTWRAVKAASTFNIVPVASHRSGETSDAYLTHLAVGMGCKVIKAGVVGGERITKANELLRVGEEIGVENLSRVGD